MPQQVSLQHEIFPTFIISVLLTPAQITKVNNNNRKRDLLNIKNLDFFYFFKTLCLLSLLTENLIWSSVSAMGQGARCHRERVFGVFFFCHLADRGVFGSAK